MPAELGSKGMAATPPPPHPNAQTSPPTLLTPERRPTNHHLANDHTYTDPAPESRCTDLPSDSDSDMDHSGFIEVQSRKRARRASPPLTPAPQTKPPNKEGRIPPIIVSGVSKWTPIFSRFRSAGAVFTAKFVGDRLHLLVNNVESFRSIQRDLTTNGVEFHTFSLKEDQELKTVIRGLPCFTEPQEIQKALEDLGFSPTHVAALERRDASASHPTNAFYVKFRKSGSWAQIWKTTEILGIKITVDQFSPRNAIPQCFRCQQFGHGSRNCHRPIKCVRCGGPHARDACTLPEGATPKCANCEMGHPASWRGCEAHHRAKQALNRHEPARRPQEAHPRAPRRQPSAPRRQQPPPAPPAPTPAMQPTQETEDTPTYAEVAWTSNNERRRNRPNRNPANRVVSGNPAQRQSSHSRVSTAEPAKATAPTSDSQPRRCGTAGIPPRPTPLTRPGAGNPGPRASPTQKPTSTPASTDNSTNSQAHSQPTQQDHISITALTKWITSIVPIILGGEKSPRDLLAAIMLSVQELLSYG